MPVFNTPVEYLVEAVDSIKNQTYKNYEFIIIDDGSKDEETKKYLSQLQGINLITLQSNQGISNALNVGVMSAKGDLIARMDSDDISLP